MKNDARSVYVFPVSMHNCTLEAIPNLPLELWPFHLTLDSRNINRFTNNRSNGTGAPNESVWGKYAFKMDITIHAP
jgi:hypothetical protein